MELSTITAPLPLQKDVNGVIRVGKTRITLETVITAFKNGSTCEEIIYQYPSLELADVYSVVSHYLRHQAEVETYLKKRQKKAKIIRQKTESHFDSQGIRERLMSRRDAKNV